MYARKYITVHRKSFINVNRIVSQEHLFKNRDIDIRLNFPLFLH